MKITSSKKIVPKLGRAAVAKDFDHFPRELMSESDGKVEMRVWSGSGRIHNIFITEAPTIDGGKGEKKYVHYVLLLISHVPQIFSLYHVCTASPIFFPFTNLET
jgi:hypothetical protein